VPSEAFEATSTSEFGDGIGLAASGYLSSARVLMSSWGCESRPGGVCTTTPGSTFAVPITFKLYTVVGGEPGSLITSRTQTFNIPYRPSDDPACIGDSAWSAPTCFHGLATPITFDLSQSPVVVSGNVIWTVSYNTTHYGYAPIGESAPCYGTSGGCGYDSLNVGLDTNASTYAGTDLDNDGVVQNSSWSGAYCSGPTGTLRSDTGCWTGFRPMAEIKLFSSTPEITTSSVAVPEGNSGPHTVNVPVNLSGPTTNTVTVKWKTRTSSAGSPADFTTANGIVTFSPGQTSKNVPITVNGDTTAENYEHFYVDFTLPTNATLSPAGTKITSTVTLQNDDLPTLKSSNITTTEGSPANLVFSLTKPYYQPVTVTLNSNNGTAIAPGDYTAIVNQQITFPAGSVTPISVPLTIKADGVLGEKTEKFTVTASSPSVVATIMPIVNISANNT
jgi:hypothetical protein